MADRVNNTLDGVKQKQVPSPEMPSPRCAEPRDSEPRAPKQVRSLRLASLHAPPPPPPPLPLSLSLRPARLQLDAAEDMDSVKGTLERLEALVADQSENHTVSTSHRRAAT